MLCGAYRTHGSVPFCTTELVPPFLSSRSIASFFSLGICFPQLLAQCAVSMCSRYTDHMTVVFPRALDEGYLFLQLPSNRPCTPLQLVPTAFPTAFATAAETRLWVTLPTCCVPQVQAQKTNLEAAKRKRLCMQAIFSVDSKNPAVSGRAWVGDLGVFPVVSRDCPPILFHCDAEACPRWGRYSSEVLLQFIRL